MAGACSRRVGQNLNGPLLGLARQLSQASHSDRLIEPGSSRAVREALRNSQIGRECAAFVHQEAWEPSAVTADRSFAERWRRNVHIGRRCLSVVPAMTNGRKSYLVDTLSLVRRLEAEGLTAKQAEAITHLITEVLHESLETAADTFVSKPDMQKSELLADAALSKFRTELQSHQDVKFTSLQRELETLKTDLDKVKSEIRYEVDKVTAGQRLDLNLERGRVKEEMNLRAQELSTLSNKLDKEVNTLQAQLEAAKFEIIRYCIGTLVSVSAIGLGLLRILM